MLWEEELRKKCYELINSEKGGEVHIQFSIRHYKGEKIAVPIIKSYPENQLICDEVKVS